MRLITLVTLVLALLAFAPAATAETIYVWQESLPGLGDFFSNPVGTIETFSTSLTVAGFYNYDSALFSYQGELVGGPTPVSDKAQIFLVEGSDGLGFALVNDQRDDGTGGRTDSKVWLAGDSAAYVVNDDPGDQYTVNAAGTAFEVINRWQPCCTDGFAIGSLDGDWRLIMDLVPVPVDGRYGITSWSAVSADGTSLPLAWNTSRRILLSPIPEPGTLLLLGLGLMGLAARRRTKR